MLSLLPKTVYRGKERWPQKEGLQGTYTPSLCPEPSAGHCVQASLLASARSANMEPALPLIDKLKQEAAYSDSQPRDWMHIHIQ